MTRHPVIESLKIVKDKYKRMNLTRLALKKLIGEFFFFFVIFCFLGQSVCKGIKPLIFNEINLLLIRDEGTINLRKYILECLNALG